MPQLLAISGTLDIEAAQAEGQLPRFRMIAATGQPMRLEGWRQPVVVDFAGLNVPSQSLPIRYNHDAAQGVGHTDRIAIEGSNLVAEGVVSRDTEAARDVVSSSKRGFPWQASIGASVDKSEFVKEGSQVMVNGRMVAGPVYVVIKSTLAEISFVDRGADQGTSAVAAKGQSMSTVVETEVETDPALIERARAREIKAIFQGEFPQIEAEEIEAGSSVDEARAAYVTALRTSRRRGGGVVVPGRLSGVTAMETLEAAILVRTGREKLAVDTLGPQAVEAARHMRAASLPDICAHALRADHRDPSGMSKSEIIQASLSTLSLPTLFSNVVTTPSPEGDGFLEEPPLELEPVSRRCPPPVPSGPSAFAGNDSSASRRVEKATPESVQLMPAAVLRGAGDSGTVPGFSPVGNDRFDLSTLEAGDSPVA